MNTKFHYIEKRTGHVRINVTLNGFRGTTVAVENSKYYIFWVRVCGLRSPACRAHASYYTVICGLSYRTIFFRIIS